MTNTPRYASAGSGHYASMLAALVLIVVLSAIGASKGVVFGPVVTDAAFFMFPLCYILGDMITEIYGPQAARRAIIAGFAGSIFSVIIYSVIIVLPGFGDDYGLAKQQALEVALGPVWVVVLASVCGYLAGQSSNSFIMWRGKKRHQESRLYQRLSSATGVGEAVDSIIFCTIAASAIGISTVGQWASYTFFGFLWKVLVQFALMPVTGRVIGWVKAHEPSYGTVEG
nr:queuosine precursor transporter [Propionibacterium sp. oral taxon 192]